MAFLADLHDVRASRIGPWLIGGDFNMILSEADKNNSHVNRRITASDASLSTRSFVACTCTVGDTPDPASLRSLCLSRTTTSSPPPLGRMRIPIACSGASLRLLPTTVRSFLIVSRAPPGSSSSTSSVFDRSLMVSSSLSPRLGIPSRVLKPLRVTSRAGAPSLLARSRCSFRSRMSSLLVLTPP